MNRRTLLLVLLLFAGCGPSKWQWNPATLFYETLSKRALIEPRAAHPKQPRYREVKVTVSRHDFNWGNAVSKLIDRILEDGHTYVIFDPEQLPERNVGSVLWKYDSARLVQESVWVGAADEFITLRVRVFTW